MYRKLTPKEVVYSINLDSLNIRDVKENLDYHQVFQVIRRALSIDDEGYNVYIIDNFSKDKVKGIVNFAQYIYKDKKVPKDICYFSDKIDNCPKAIFLTASKGNLLKEMVEEIKNFYFDITFDFYNNSVCKEKEDIMDLIEEKRNNIIEELISMAKDKGFHMKAMHNGFTFIPIDEGKEMTENEYDELSEEGKSGILNKISELKSKSKEILEELKYMEENNINKVKNILELYYKEKCESIKLRYRILFSEDTEAIEFLDDMCKNIEETVIENYSASYSEDEALINSTLEKFMLNVLVDNTNNKTPICVFEEDPSVQNLIGSIEYENRNGVYTTDVELIKAGTLLKSNEGCVILRMNSLLANASSYYYLKKALSTGKIDFNYNRGYLELLSLNGLKPEPIPIKLKVILIGDYETYNLLYSYDEDFKKLFKMKAEYYPVSDIDTKSANIIIKNLKDICSNNEIKNLKNDAIEEIFKYLSRTVENNKKVYLEKDEIKKIVVLANSKAKEEKKQFITAEDVIDVAYKEEIIEKNILKSYKEKKQFIGLNGEEIGQINALSVIDGEYFRFGKPIRITCCCYSGSGNIFDVHKESNLSGNIHSKSINILKGFMNNLLGGYETIPVDFHLSFEQLYGYLDGDSASVAEIVAMISSLSKLPLKQNIAVTGSIDQFGRVQPVGGVNEKIEGFFKVCKETDSVAGKGVIIPNSNIDNLVLNKEVEESICKGDFSIYSVEDVFDATYILLNKDKQHILNTLQKEVKKYTKNKRNK